MLLEFTQTPVDAPYFGNNLPVLNELRNGIVYPREGVRDLHHDAESDHAEKQAGTEDQKRNYPYIIQIGMFPEIKDGIEEVQSVPVRAYGII